MSKKTKYIVEVRTDYSKMKDIYGRKICDETEISPWIEYGEYFSEEEAIEKIMALKIRVQELYDCRIRKITITDKVIKEITL